MRPHAKLVEKNYAEMNTTPFKPASKAASRTSAKNPTSHSRGSSIASTVTSSPQSVRKPPSSNMKPPSTVGTAKPASPTGTRETPDGSTDGDAAPKPRNRKSEAERIQVFTEDPCCAEVEPFRARCKQCDTWITLHDTRKYVMKNWKEHRKVCDAGGPSTSVEVEEGPGTGAETATQPTPTSAEKGSIKPRPRRTEAERRAYLEAHPNSGEVRPGEIFCVLCHRWIKLAIKQNYVTSNWDVHQKLHPVPLDALKPPSSTSVNEENPSPEATSSPTRQLSVVQPLSDMSFSESATSEAQEASSSTSRKRTREDDDDAPQAEGRLVRARTESYKPVTGLWRRLTEPIIHFWSGFKQGLATGSDTPLGTQDTIATDATTSDTVIPPTKGTDTDTIISASPTEMEFIAVIPSTSTSA